MILFNYSRKECLMKFSWEIVEQNAIYKTSEVEVLQEIFASSNGVVILDEYVGAITIKEPRQENATPEPAEIMQDTWEKAQHKKGAYMPNMSWVDEYLLAKSQKEKMSLEAIALGIVRLWNDDSRDKSQHLNGSSPADRFHAQDLGNLHDLAGVFADAKNPTRVTCPKCNLQGNKYLKVCVNC
jgi:hypothetical protein